MGKMKVNLSANNLITQMETVRFDLNMNPHGIPKSVVNTVSNNISKLSSYPDNNYKKLKDSISEYTGAQPDNIIIGSSSYEFIKLLIEFNSPKKAILISPGSQNYENILKLNGCEIIYYNTKEDDDFVLDIADFISKLNDEIDIVFISNPNGTTSSVIDRESLNFIAKICKGNDIFLVVDEEYMEFVKDKDECTSIPLIEEYDNLVVLRNTTKFFAVPGLRLAYAITSNMVFKKALEIAGFPYPINKMAELAGIEMFRDTEYINESCSTVNTERSLVYAALASCKTIKLYKPAANFILVKLLKEDISAHDVVEYLANKGLHIRSCSDINGLDNKYVRFCFMNPKQNDLLVNTLLEIV
ncbi:MAG: pyridoxal phosphate-dependent aminotransferase [Coprococcus sp.]